MRNLLFKNLTSIPKRRKILSSCEAFDKEGMRSIIKRHFICIVKEAVDRRLEKPLPYVYVLKEHNEREQREKFFCRIKGSIFVEIKGKTYLILYIHSLKIVLSAIPKLTVS